MYPMHPVLSMGVWMLVSGFWSLASGLWPLASGLWLLVSGRVPGCVLRVAGFNEMSNVELRNSNVFNKLSNDGA